MPDTMSGNIDREIALYDRASIEAARRAGCDHPPYFSGVCTVVKGRNRRLNTLWRTASRGDRERTMRHMMGVWADMLDMGGYDV